MSVLDNLKKLAFGQGRRNLEELSERLAELPAGQEIVRTVAARTARSPTIRSGCSPTAGDPPGQLAYGMLEWWLGDLLVAS